MSNDNATPNATPEKNIDTPVTTKPAQVDYSGLKVGQLRKLAKDRKLSGYSKMGKDDLVVYLETGNKPLPTTTTPKSPEKKPDDTPKLISFEQAHTNFWLNATPKEITEGANAWRKIAKEMAGSGGDVGNATKALAAAWGIETTNVYKEAKGLSPVMLKLQPKPVRKNVSIVLAANDDTARYVNLLHKHLDGLYEPFAVSVKPTAEGFATGRKVSSGGKTSTDISDVPKPLQAKSIVWSKDGKKETIYGSKHAKNRPLTSLHACGQYVSEFYYNNVDNQGRKKHPTVSYGLFLHTVDNVRVVRWKDKAKGIIDGTYQGYDLTLTLA